MKGKQARLRTDLESRLCTIRQRLSEARERVGRDDIGLHEWDARAVSALFETAQEHAGFALHALHPEFDDMEDDDVLEAFTALDVEHWTSRTCPKDDPREDVEFVAMYVALLAHGVAVNAEQLDDRSAADEVVYAMDDFLRVISAAMRVLAPEEEQAV